MGGHRPRWATSRRRRRFATESGEWPGDVACRVRLQVDGDGPEPTRQYLDDERNAATRGPCQARYCSLRPWCWIRSRRSPAGSTTADDECRDGTAYAAAHVIQAIALSQEVLERTRRRRERRAVGLIGSDELRSRMRLAHAFVADAVVNRRDCHRRRKVRQVEERSGGTHCESAPGVEAEEVHARSIGDPHVRSDVELGKCRDQGQRWNASGTHVRHGEWNDPKPRVVFEEVQFECWRDNGAKHRSIDLPVREQQIVPGLCHHPRGIRHRPRAVLRARNHRCVEIVGQVPASTSRDSEVGVVPLGVDREVRHEHEVPPLNRSAIDVF